MDIPVGIVLKEWQSFITTISRNLMELSEQADVKITKLKVKDTVNGYTGLTRDKAVKALDTMDTLWRYYALLSSVIDKAADLYSKDSFLRDTEREVKELLENTPVTLETQRIDISSRGLLTPENTSVKVSLQELLKIMQDAFEATRNTFTEISEASKTIQTRLDNLKNEIQNLSDTACQLGIKDMPLFDTSKVAVVESDPLKGLSELDALQHGVQMYKASIESTIRDYNETAGVLNRIRYMLYEIEDLSQKSQNAAAESKKLFGTLYPPRPVIREDVLQSLKDWLSVLESKLSEGSLSATKIGAQRLEHECALKLDMERESYQNNSKDYNEWQDLKGEFKALKAKFEGLKMRGLSFDSSLYVLIEKIQASLYADKVNLSDCKLLVEKFRLGLRS